MSGITKRFGNVTALDSVDLEVAQGAVHAVVGENGAGKTTLMRILYGVLAHDEGTIELGIDTSGIKTSGGIRPGIGMVSQHYGIIPELTCLQNLILGAEGGPILQPRQAEAKARSLAERMGFQFDWSRDARELSPTGAQKLEILKLLWREAKVMILDEPTAMLSPADSDALFHSMQQLAGEGATIILVTHRLPEVLEYCSRVTVLRGGKRVDEKLVSETNGGELAKLIVGGDLIQREPATERPPGASVLKVSQLTVRGDRGNETLKSVNLEAREGEVVGIAGVDGSGQRELIQAIYGLIEPSAGAIELSGQPAQAGVPSRIERGVRIIPEDRHEEGVVEEWSLDENAALGLQRLAPFAKGSAVDPSARHTEAESIAQRFNTKHGGLNMPMASLSGGNQQRFIAARALCVRPKLILAFQPARGLDLNATQNVYKGIREACDAGAAAIIVSFDLDELLEHCDRIVAMNNGKLSVPSRGEEKDRNAIGRLMVGAE